jgi:Domain of unknown function (DUF5624)
VSAFESLFRTYTAAPDSIAARLSAAAAAAAADDPLIVATGSDIAVYPGGGCPPTVQSIRLATRGFRELAGISHLGPAVATVLRLKELALKELAPDGAWRDDAERLIEACSQVRSANSVNLWREQIAVPAYAGREAAIAALAGYACRLTERYLERALADPGYLCRDSLRADYLEGASPVPFNRVMIATFFLTGMDIAHRVIGWLDRLALPWERGMVMMAGPAGKPTGAVTRETHSIAGIIEDAARGRLPAANLLIAPHAPAFPPFDGTNLDQVAVREGDYRRLYARLSSVAALGPVMFGGYPSFAVAPRRLVPLRPGQASVREMPAIGSPGDWHALTTRLRLVLEDPRQLLSSAVTDYASQQLIAHGNVPAAVTVPGLDGEPYPSSEAAW